MGNVKCGISRKRLNLELNGWKCGTRGYCSARMEGDFDAQFLEFGLGSFGAL